MKQNLLRIGCAAAGLALAAGVFTSCSLLPTPSRPCLLYTSDAADD